MKRAIEDCDAELISRYLDEELTADEEARVHAHLKDCSVCQETLTDYGAASSLFRTHANEVLSHADFAHIEQRILARVQRKRLSGKAERIGFSRSRKYLIPALALAGALVLFFSIFRSSTPVLGPDPSAIVDSFTGEVSSVMIVVTPESNQTVIWIKEAMLHGGEGNETEENHDHSTYNHFHWYADGIYLGRT